MSAVVDLDPEQKRKAEILYSGKYSDSSITCGGTVFKTHRAILSCRSDYFEKLFGSEFQESLAASANIDDDPALFARVLQYIDLNTYTTGSVAESAPDGTGQFSSINDAHTSDERHLHANMYAVADRLMLDDLTMLAMKNFAASFFNNEVKPSTDEAYVDDEDDRLHTFIYESTPSHDRGLRDMLLIAMLLQMEERALMSDEKFRSLLERVPVIAVDLLSKRLLDRHDRYDFQCTECHKSRAVLSQKCKCGKFFCCEGGECIDEILTRELCYRCWATGSLRRLEWED